MVCGKPLEFGYINVKITVSKDGVNRTIKVPVYIYGGIESYEKAERIRDTINAGARADSITATGTGSTVWVAGDDRWKVTGVTVGDDETKEPEKLLSSAPPSDQQALCSLSGEASGLAVDGSPSFLRVGVSGQTVFIPIFQGMPASVVEQQLISSSRRTVCRRATPPPRTLRAVSKTWTTMAPWCGCSPQIRVASRKS
jgi:hypothetical protein